MSNKNITIIDFGSSKITCMSALPIDKNGEFVIKAVGQHSYNGFDDNSWYEPETIKDAVIDAIVQVEQKTGSKVKEIVVGVPGAFCAVATSEASLTFHSKKKIDSDDVVEIIKKADIFGNGNDITGIGGSAVYYLLDGAIKTNQPIGSIATKLTALVSFSFAKNYFINTVANILADKGIKRVCYMNTCQAQSRFVAQSMGCNTAIIMDVGHITTNVMLHSDCALLFERTFALGSGYLASDICTVCGCNFDFAMNMLEKANLNLDVQTGDAYSINGKMVDAYQTNEILRARIGQIASYVIKSFSCCDREIPSNTDVILTGGGLTYLRGGVDCLSQCLGKQIKIYSSVNPQLRKNEYTSCYGLIYQSVLNENYKNKWFFVQNKNKGDR